MIPLDFEMNTILTKEKADKFRKILTYIDTYSEEIIEFFKEISYQEMMKSSLSQIKQNFVRVYVLNGLDFANKDMFGNSDPFIVVSCGKKSFSTKENYLEDEPNPDIYKMFDFAMSFPGASPVVIEAYDYDMLFGDDLIGKTIIDLDDREYCPEWKKM
jgi:Ca2+-dependent lipid-binding protein